jgi:hypothetical protein
MSSDTPPTDLWLEQSRLDGMMLGAVTYGEYLVYGNLEINSRAATGGFFILTVQAAAALIQRPRHGGKIADHRLALLVYVVVTFILGTIGFAANAKYTEMIWIDLRGALGGPVELIENEMTYPINVVAISW